MPETDEHLRAYLADHDTPCPNCGYNLRHLTGDACPECGQLVTLGVHLVEPRLGVFIAGLIGLAMSAGFSTLFLVMAGLESLTGRSMPPSQIVLYFAVGAVLSLGLLAVWIGKRRWLRSFSRQGQRLAAVGCWIVPLVNLGVGEALFS